MPLNAAFQQRLNELAEKGDRSSEMSERQRHLEAMSLAREAADGEMVVALVSGEGTLKRIYRDNDSTVRLQPANPSVPVLMVAEERVRIQGVVIGVLRRFH